MEGPDLRPRIGSREVETSGSEFGGRIRPPADVLPSTARTCRRGKSQGRPGSVARTGWTSCWTAATFCWTVTTLCLTSARAGEADRILQHHRPKDPKESQKS